MRRTRTLVSLLAMTLPLAVASAGRAQTARPAPPATAPAPPLPGKNDPREKEIMQAENRLMEAIRTRDRAALEGLVADDFLYTGPLSSGELSRRSEFVAGNLGGVKLDTFRFERVHVRTFAPDVVVANVVCRQKGTIGGRPWNPDYLFTDVWVKRDGRWQLAGRHVTKPIRVVPDDHHGPVVPPSPVPKK